MRRILDYVDFEKANVLLDGFYQSTGFVTAIIGLDGKILSKSGWRNICTIFHRVNAKTALKCIASDTILANEANDGNKFNFYKCHNGLYDVAIPIIIKGEHIANLFTGQIFFEDPDISFFKKQAKKYGFDEELYIKYLMEVPIVSKKEVRSAMEFLKNIMQMIIELTAERLDQEALVKKIKEKELTYKALFDYSGVAIAYFTVNGDVISYNEKAAQNMGLVIEDFIGKNIADFFQKMKLKSFCID